MARSREDDDHRVRGCTALYSACTLSDFYGMMHLALPPKQTRSISILISIDKSFATIGNSAQ
jgi:hypothetical protein